MNTKHSPVDYNSVMFTIADFNYYYYFHRNILINKDFPAEHPYSSHMPRYAVFPNFISSEDPKRGVNARREQPINAEMPATGNHVTIVHKTKGDTYIIQKHILLYPIYISMCSNQMKCN